MASTMPPVVKPHSVTKSKEMVLSNSDRTGEWEPRQSSNG